MRRPKNKENNLLARSEAGFTLIEMMISLGLLAIVTAGVSTYVVHHRARELNQEDQSNLEQFRNTVRERLDCPKTLAQPDCTSGAQVNALDHGSRVLIAKDSSTKWDRYRLRVTCQGSKKGLQVQARRELKANSNLKTDQMTGKTKDWFDIFGGLGPVCEAVTNANTSCSATLDGAVVPSGATYPIGQIGGAKPGKLIARVAGVTTSVGAMRVSLVNRATGVAISSKDLNGNSAAELMPTWQADMGTYDVLLTGSGTNKTCATIKVTPLVCDLRGAKAPAVTIIGPAKSVTFADVKGDAFLYVVGDSMRAASLGSASVGVPGMSIYVNGSAIAVGASAPSMHVDPTGSSGNDIGAYGSTCGTVNAYASAKFPMVYQVEKFSTYTTATTKAGVIRPAGAPLGCGYAVSTPAPVNCEITNTNMNINGPASQFRYSTSASELSHIDSMTGTITRACGANGLKPNGFSFNASGFGLAGAGGHYTAKAVASGDMSSRALDLTIPDAWRDPNNHITNHSCQVRGGTKIIVPNWNLRGAAGYSCDASMNATFTALFTYRDCHILHSNGSGTGIVTGAVTRCQCHP